MAVLNIRKAGDMVLKKKAEPVVRIDRKIKQLLDDMSQTMYHADGVGLAAPQVGVSQRIIVIDVGEGLIELINPVITASEGSLISMEGCLSVPGIYGDVERCTTVTVEGFDRHRKKVRISATDLLAKALQHEIDHLEGILFIELAKTIHKEQKS
ncbi:MAG: Peptide deformylase [Firmicutes bacterium]|nr:Peptide deformylase [Bacillota bacterium]